MANRTIVRLSVLCLGVAGLQACASTVRTERVDRVDIGDTVVLLLPTVAELVESLDATQIVTGTFDGRSYTMQAQLEWRPGSITLAALNVWGATVFSIAYDGTAIRVQGNPALTQGLRPEYVLADILLVHLEHPTLVSSPAGDHITIDDAPSRRTINKNGQPVIVIEYEDGQRRIGAVKLENVARGYVMQIQTLEYTNS
jgi:hypothetical protein